MKKKLRIDDIIFDKEKYPREGLHSDWLSSLRLNLQNLPLIEVNKNNILCDGYHRLTAYKMDGYEGIEVKVIDIPDNGVLEYAVKKNATHGMQLTSEEKETLARKWAQDEKENREIAELLSVDDSTVSRWVKDITNERTEERNEEIFQLWLACHTQEEIAEKFNIKRPRVTQIIEKVKKLKIQEINIPDSLKYFDVWNFSQCSPGYGIKGYPGRIPGQIIENLLHHFTDPFDIVLDPMTGSGTTIDVCKKMLRRYQAYDINPVKDETKKYDITQGLPNDIKKPDLIFLDPPYYKKKDDKYITGSISSLSRNAYLSFFHQLVDQCKQILRENGKIALLVSNYINYENSKDSIVGADYYAIFLKHFKILYEIQCPLTTQQYQAFDIKKAKEKKKLLIISRSLWVFQK